MIFDTVELVRLQEANRFSSGTVFLKPVRPDLSCLSSFRAANNLENIVDIEENGALFVEGSVGTRIFRGASEGSEAILPILALHEIKPGLCIQDIPLVIFQSADSDDPDILRTLKAIPPETLLVRTTRAKALYDACVSCLQNPMFLEEISFMKGTDKAAAREKLVITALETLQNEGYPKIQAAFLSDNRAIFGQQWGFDGRPYIALRDFYQLRIRPSFMLDNTPAARFS